MQKTAYLCQPGSWERLHIKQILLVMKLTIVLLTATFLQVFASGSAQRITLKGTNLPITQLFTAIEAQTGYVVFSDKALLKDAKPVTVNALDVPLADFLQTTLKDQPFAYALEGKTIVISKKGYQTDAVNNLLDFFPIKGIVKSPDGNPLAGATVTVRGENNVAITDAKGNFLINALTGQVLVFTYIGYESYEYKIGSNAEVNVSLKIKSNSIDSVTFTINTGYQKIKPREFVGSYAQLDSAAFHRRTGLGILDRLDGTVPSVVFDRKSGSVSGYPIKIRGISTLGTQNTSKSPLIVVDNFPMPDQYDLNVINPNDVQSVTVLKDAAATSIWGSRAGNGVIVITTKRGRFSQPVSISVTSNVAIDEKPDLFYPQLLSPSQFIEVEKMLFSKGFYDNTSFLTNTTNRPVVSPVIEILAKTRSGLSEAEANQQIDALRGYDIRTELTNRVYRPAVRQQHYLNLNGGTDKLSFQFSGGYNHSLNNTQGSKPDDQVTMMANTTYKATSKLQLETGINLTYGVQKSTTFPLGINQFSPYSQLANDLGNPLAIPYQYRTAYVDTVGKGRYLDGRYRPLDEVRLVDNVATGRTMRVNAAARYQVLPWMSANIQYQFLSGTTTTRNVKSLQTFEARNLINQFTNLNRTDALRYPIPMGGLLDLSSDLLKNHNLRGTLDFNRNWGGKHSITGLIGGELSERSGYSHLQRVYGYDDVIGSYSNSIDFVTSYPRYYASAANAVGRITNTNTYAEQPYNRFVSLMANASYSYDNRYTIYASGRRDGANIFGVSTNNKWKPLWSAGASWNISGESFYQVNWLSSLRLRGSYGYTGNVNNTLSGKPTLRYRTALDELTGNQSADIGLAPNPDLRWEQVIIKNGGLDFTLFNRLSGSVDVFRKNANDVISNYPYPFSSGVETFVVNAASLKTKGLDVSLNYHQPIGPVQWDATLGFSSAKTTVTELYLAARFRASEYISYGLNASKGQMVYGLSSYRWAGLDPATGDPQGYLKGQVSKDYTGIANDSIQNQVFHGSAIPLQTAFFTNSFTWKGVSVSANITGKFRYYFREPKMSLLYSASYQYTTDYLSRWQKAGDETTTDMPSMSYPMPSNASVRNGFYQAASNTVKRGDNIRVQDIRLSYNLTREKLHQLPFKSVQVFGYLNNWNLFLWRKDASHYDPDLAADITFLRPVKTWTVGASIQF